MLKLTYKREYLLSSAYRREQHWTLYVCVRFINKENLTHRMISREYKLKIKDLPPEERPRERLSKYGPKTLSNAELLALILGNGSKKECVLELSRKLLKENTIKTLSRKRVNALKSNLGIGEAKACQIIACFELGRRLAAFKEQTNPTINNAKDITKIFMPELYSLKKEHFKTIFLDSRQKVIKDETIFIGSLNASIVHPREIFQAALEEGAAGIILLHNHPSGNPDPSEEDIEITKQLVKAGEILGIEVLDHIIIANKRYFSFKEKGYL